MDIQNHTVLLKLSGELLTDENKQPSPERARALCADMALHKDIVQWALVIGGGNIFRGSSHSSRYGISQETGHQVGMLATVLNGLMLKDLAAQCGLSIVVLAPWPHPLTDGQATPATIAAAFEQRKIPLFVGGTGVPYVTTDTAAVIRALQCKADQIWKVTGVDGLYSADPAKDPQAYFIPHLTYQDYLARKLGLLDTTACVLAEQYDQTIRILSHQVPNVLSRALSQPTYGSILNKG